MAKTRTERSRWRARVARGSTATGSSHGDSSPAEALRGRSPGTLAAIGGQGTVAVLAGVALAACAGGGPNRSAPLDVGDPAPPSLQLSGSGPALVWAFNSVDCLTCKLAESSWVVRRLQRRFRGLKTVVAAVGPGSASDREMVAGFLASERIQATIVMQTRKVHAGEFGGGAPLPALYLVGRSGTTVTAAVPDPTAPGVPDWDRFDLDAVLHRLAQSVDADEEPNSTHTTRKENNQ